MKYLVFFTLLLCLSCKSQNPIISLLEYRYGDTNGAYYKDVNNDMDTFEGTWTYQNGGTVFTMVLEKKEQITVESPSGNTFFADKIIGEYKYVENGQTLMDYLPTLNTKPIFNHNLTSASLLHKFLPPRCDACGPDELRLKLFFKDPERAYLPAMLVLRHRINRTGGEELLVTLTQRDSYMRPSDTAPIQTRVPFGEYVMVKQ